MPLLIPNIHNVYSAICGKPVIGMRYNFVALICNSFHVLPVTSRSCLWLFFSSLVTVTHSALLLYSAGLLHNSTLLLHYSTGQISYYYAIET